MAAFSSYQDINMSHFLVDSAYLKIMSEEGNKTMNSNGFSQIDPHQGEPILQQTNPCLDHHSLSHDDKGSAMAIKQSSESSTVVDKFESGEQVTQKLISPIGRKRKTRNGSGSGSSSNSAQSKDARVGKGKNQKQCNGEGKEKQQKPKPEHQEPPSGYIHVRARRGQATDSHSLAERVRREKISERMKVLQRLVPGCDKVTGKALMLDQIINYVQSLQNQVEFLSMKIASVNTMSFDFSLVEDSFTLFSPEERLISMHTSPLPHCSPNQLPPPAATIRPNGYDNTVDTSAFSQEHYFQDNASLLWAVVEQGQEFHNPSGFNDNVSSFN